MLPDRKTGIKFPMEKLHCLVVYTCTNKDLKKDKRYNYKQIIIGFSAKINHKCKIFETTMSMRERRKSQKNGLVDYLLSRGRVRD